MKGHLRLSKGELEMYRSVRKTNRYSEALVKNRKMVFIVRIMLDPKAIGWPRQRTRTRRTLRDWCQNMPLREAINKASIEHPYGITAWDASCCTCWLLFRSLFRLMPTHSTTLAEIGSKCSRASHSSNKECYLWWKAKGTLCCKYNGVRGYQASSLPRSAPRSLTIITGRNSDLGLMQVTIWLGALLRAHSFRSPAAQYKRLCGVAHTSGIYRYARWVERGRRYNAVTPSKQKAYILKVASAYRRISDYGNRRYRYHESTIVFFLKHYLLYWGTPNRSTRSVIPSFMPSFSFVQAWWRLHSKQAERFSIRFVLRAHFVIEKSSARHRISVYLYTKPWISYSLKAIWHFITPQDIYHRSRNFLAFVWTLYLNAAVDNGQGSRLFGNIEVFSDLCLIWSTPLVYKTLHAFERHLTAVIDEPSTKKPYAVMYGDLNGVYGLYKKFG